MTEPSDDFKPWRFRIHRICAQWMCNSSSRAILHHTSRVELLSNVNMSPTNGIAERSLASPADIASVQHKEAMDAVNMSRVFGNATDVFSWVPNNESYISALNAVL